MITKFTPFLLFLLIIFSHGGVSAKPSNDKGGEPKSRIETVKKTEKQSQIKLIDINSANNAELMKLPGIDDIRAKKIIAGRPYGSKAQLVASNIIDFDVYQNIKKKIIANQTKKTFAQMMELKAKK